MSHRRTRILLVHPGGLNENPRTGGQQRYALWRRHLEALGDVVVFQAPRWDAPGRRGYYTGTREVLAADLAAAHCARLSRHRPPGEGARAYAALAAQGFDVVAVLAAACAWWVGSVEPRRGILNLNDLPSQLFAQRERPAGALARALAGARLARLRWSERRLADAFCYVAVCSEDERRWLGRPGVEVVPNAYWPHPAMADARPGEGGPTPAVLFVGSLFWPPNQRGLAWLVDEVWPRVHARQPGLVLRVVGHLRSKDLRRGPALPWASGPGIDFVGPVDEVAPFLREALCSVAPLFEGGGTRIKIAESLAFGTPVVATPRGAAGLELAEAEGVLRRADPDSFAEAILELAESPARRRALGVAGRDAVRERYSPEAQARALGRLVESILAEAGRAT